MTTWGFNIWAPTGYSKGSRTPDNSFVFRSGLRMQVTPEGDCREATFTAKGAGLGIGPLDCVQVTWNGAAIFYGEVRVGGNPYDVDGHQITLRSLALRLKEISIPPDWIAPKQNAGLTVQSMINAVLPQLNGTVSIGAIALPFDCRAIVNANQQNPYALLEQIASDGAGLGVKVRFGVNANRQFFCVPAREDVAALTNEMMTGQTQWVAPVAENPVTAVVWYVSKKPDGSWLTYRSVAPEASVYGVRTKDVSLSSSEGLWINVNGSISYLASQDGQTLQSVTPAQALDPTIIGNPDSTAISTAAFNAQTSEVQMSFTQPPDRIVAEFSTTKTFPGSTVETPTLAATSTWIGDKFVESSGGNWTLYPTYAATSIKLDDAQSFYQVDASGKAGALYKATQSLIHVRQLRGEVLNTALLDQLAHFHYNIPATAPADLELRDFTGNRTGYVTYNGWQSPVDVWEYRLTAARGMTTGILAGQPDSPEKLAQAALIKRRDNLATIAAITSNV